MIVELTQEDLDTLLQVFQLADRDIKEEVEAGFLEQEDADGLDHLRKKMDGLAEKLGMLKND
jgi:hypothetical protein